ncbi:alkaline phosphatase PhoX [Asanoa sp. NPDC049573]|uniref:PhoX family protein n=1 Tax=Asanoa sp. NPDC049573 TaxID=3155396 RepID=UPI0034293354
MSDLDRRSVLRGAAAAAGGVVLGGPFLGFVNRDTAAANGPQRAPLVDTVADLRDGKVRLHVPAGFQYRSFHDTEAPVVLDDGTALPGRHDGMGAFRDRGDDVVLIRNHEVNNPGPAFGPREPYDPQARGGTTTVHVSRTGEVRRAYTSINGTMMNCSGGRMPWGSWVTCEETVNGPDVGPDFTNASNVPLTQPHGYVFEVPVHGEASGEPITAAGRFTHEAVAYDPHSGYLYLTEDSFEFPSGFYRYKPRRDPMRLGHLDNRGRLQMLAVRKRPNIHLEGMQRRGATYDVKWVDIDDPAPRFPYTPGETAPTTNDDATVYVPKQGWAQGAAYFSRLEGAVYDDGVVYFTSTQGGGEPETEIGPHATDGYGNGYGQVWAYYPKHQVLRAIYQSPGPDTLDFPDNVTTSPRGTLVVCEDHTDDNYLRGLTPHGELFDIAVNRLTSSTGTPRFDDEFAGSTFSPDGHTLFVNIQASAGMTFAIWGDWRRIGV